MLLKSNKSNNNKFNNNKFNNNKFNNRLSASAGVFFFLIFFVAIGAVGQALFASTATAAATRELDCKYVPVIQEGYLNQHVSYKKMDKNLERRVIDQILKHLDPLKIYFLKSDENRVRRMLSGILSKTQKANCSQIFDVNAFLAKKVQDRVDFVRSYLGNDEYKFDKNTKLILDSDERKRFPSTKALNKFHKKYIHFQISNYLLTDVDLEEAKQNVIKNYERFIKKLKKEDQEDHLADYIDTYAHSLDPHSSFFSADALESFRIQMSLSLEGIGTTLSWKDGFTVVESLIPGGAADKSGKIKPKDKIVAVRQAGSKKAENIIEQELNEVVKKIRGKKGTKVFLTILRKIEGETKRLEIELTREKINLEDEAAKITYHKKKVEGYKKLIGLIELPSFYSDGRQGRGSRSAAKDVEKLLLQARAKKVDGIVLDLSQNGGGSLDDAVKIAGLFFKTGNVVKQSFPDKSRPMAALADTDPDVVYGGPLVILTSRASASASEIVSGALKDYGRALVVGANHTFGKGTIQTIRDLPKGLGALKVTIGMFFTSGGYSTQHRGVEADIVFPSVLAQEDIGEKSYDYSLPPQKLPSFLSSDAFVHKGPDSWKILDKETIQTLRGRAESRISKNEKFIKIRENIKKTKARGKVIDLAEVMKEGEDKKTGDKKEDRNTILSPKEKAKKYLERADINEALNVASDLIIIHQEGKRLTLTANEPKKAASFSKKAATNP